MNLSMLIIGDEILDGTVKDLNAKFVGDHIENLNIKVSKIVVVGDDIEKIKESYEFIKKESDIVVIGGGLGPTPDDKTRFALSEFYGFEPQLDEGNWEIVKGFFKRRDRDILESNKVQSFKPEEFHWIDNIQGTAAGLTYFDGEVVFYSLPGVPYEFSQMFEVEVLPDIFKRFEISEAKVNRIRLAGIGESTIYNEIKAYPESENISYLPNADDGVLIKYSDKDQRVKQLLIEKLSEYIVSFDGSLLEDNIVSLLKEQQLTISFAESCTGGSICGKLTTVSGSSSVIKGGIVCYMTEIKESILKVDSSIIEKYGVVSKQCAEQLSMNVREICNTDLGLSITGYFGPTGGDEFAEVGTVYISISSKNDTTSQKIMLGTTDRVFNKSISIQRALSMLLNRLRIVE